MATPELGFNRGLLRKLANYFIRQPGNSGARVYGSEFTHNKTSSWLPIIFDTERWDTGWITDDGGTTRGYWRDDGNADWERKLFAQKAGWHDIKGHVRFENDATATGRRVLGIDLNGSNVRIGENGDWGITANGPRISVSAHWWMEAGDYVELVAYQSSGGNLGILEEANISPEFSIVRSAG